MISRTDIQAPLLLLKNGAVVDGTGRLIARIVYADKALASAMVDGAVAKLAHDAMVRSVREGVTIAKCGGPKFCKSCTGRTND